MRRGTIIGFVICALIPALSAPAQAQDYAFTYTCADQGDVIHPDSLGLFYTYLTNTGAAADTYWVVIDKALPVPWQAMACITGAGCFFDRAPVGLEPDSSAEITVDILPIQTDTTDIGGAGTVTMRVASTGDTTLQAALDLTAITNVGVDVLIVDDDGGQGYETYYQAALDGAGRSHGTLENATTVIGTDRMAPFSAVVWFTGEAVPVLTAEDRQAISGYLNGGGRLFISGQDIASALCDSASEESDASSVEWFESTFAAAYGGEYGAGLGLEGLGGNGISEGLTLNIFGGDGAGNQTSTDIVEPIFGATAFAYPVFYYSDYSGAPPMAAFTVSTGIYRAVFFAFGFEAIDAAADRTLLMDRIMDYFEGPTPVEGQPPAGPLPRDFSLSPNYPHPFNATTAWALFVPGDRPAGVSLRIYNALGQEVRVLIDGPVGPGSHLILWDGTGGAGDDLASGVYFARLESEGFSQIRKIVLTR
jgi:hypothetical protein